MALDLVTAIYAAVISGGGILGYVRAGSVASLAMGLVCGILMLYGAFQIGQDVKNVALSLATCLVLTGVMGYRFSKSGKLMPAGLVAILSLIMVFRLGYNAVKN